MTDTTSSTGLRVAEAAAEALEGVTEGPWAAWDRNVGWEVHYGDGIPLNDGYRDLFTASDARFIAYARQGVPTLLAELKGALAREELLANEVSRLREAWAELKRKIDARTEKHWQDNSFAQGINTAVEDIQGFMGELDRALAQVEAVTKREG